MATINPQDSYQGSYRAGTIAMTILGILFVILRFLARWKKSLKPGLDDYVILAALIPLLTLVGLMLSLTDYGMGLHSEILPAENIMMIAKLLVVFECIYVTTIAVTKVSILLMYCRIFPTREIRIASMILGGISLAWAIAIILVSIFQCTPIARAWDTRIPGTCIDLKASFIGNAVPNIVTDILILSLPVRVVWGLHASLTHRLSVIGIFLLGSFVIFTSIYRFTTLFEFNPEDIAWTLGNACTWCIVESSTGIISACMPTLRPLFLMVSSKFSSQSGTQKSRTTDLENSKGYELDNSALRPADEQRNKTKVHLDVSQADDASGDEVPLNSIRVQRDMTWHESGADSFRGYK
ncbi:uncharacterized protein N7479_009979 [Penicillium vulpinum]|uniref:Rhodopsin domain-containing protein n=1 Tax=Penicillium vulpinum TaxID=29845 RepID=A0A1V6RCU3_9EURO|nr:uncharacterized protein N7479_009979 [Penicillium vulpinum]KAJ5951566.1 hypothetical protein N7479_009979 [Penicillium vulpinum]OQD99002.1 hypothetical protein PENVUL_c067G04948 [Penicillium vulpinum]